MNNHENFYRGNLQYSRFLDTQSEQDFQKYTDYILKYTNNQDKVLDVGCGTGIALEIVKHNNRQAFGVEISKSSRRRCAQRGLYCRTYDGRKLPFRDQSFDLVGSYNVLEHTDKPACFLRENLRVTKEGGFLIVACPNFLSITNNYHHHTCGISRKLRNLIATGCKLFSRQVSFEKMTIIKRQDFWPDDDACNITNPLDVSKWAHQCGLKRVYWSSQSIYRKGVVKFLDHSFLRLFLGSLFMVFRKV